MERILAFVGLEFEVVSDAHELNTVSVKRGEVPLEVHSAAFIQASSIGVYIFTTLSSS